MTQNAFSLSIKQNYTDDQSLLSFKKDIATFDVRGGSVQPFRVVPDKCYVENWF